MKIPGIGEVKPAYLYVGLGSVGAIVIYGYYKKKSSSTANAAAAAAAVSSTQNQGNGSIDPTTGIPYADEGGVYGYGGIDPETGIPYEYENADEQAYEEYGSQSEFQTNDEWAQAAIQDAQADLGAAQTLAQTAVSGYLGNQALPANEYDLMQEILGLLGPPPVGTFPVSYTHLTLPTKA